ncbi:MAG: TRAP transporter small permease subunit [Rhodospirillaceae bacterium]|nr:TRAP transporter small permease subunit [Rhodospirillaceae bacterium]
MRRVYEALTRAEAILAGTFLVLMVLLIFTGGVARLVRHPQNWTIDLATCFFAWAAFMCADVAWRKGSMMSIDLLVVRLPQRLQRAMLYANYLIIAAFLVYAIYAGVHLAWVSRARSFQGIPGVSYSWVTMSLPVGAALLLLTTGLKVRTALVEDGLVRGAGAEPPHDQVQT